MLVPTQDSEPSCTCVRSIDFFAVSMICQLDFGTVPKVWYFFYFLFYCSKYEFERKLTVSLIKLTILNIGPWHISNVKNRSSQDKISI